MRKRTVWVMISLLLFAAFLQYGCKPIPYYLQQVCKVYGQVTDAKTDDPLESVEVSVAPYQYSELTNGLGDYELEMAVGTWTVEFTKEGYEPKSVDVNLETVGQRIELNAKLVPMSTGEPVDGTITVKLTGADEFNGQVFLDAVFPPGVRDQTQGLGWDVNPITEGEATNVSYDSQAPDPQPVKIFTGGESYDIVALIFPEGSSPAPGVPYAEKTGVVVDGDIVVTFVYPDDFVPYSP